MVTLKRVWQRAKSIALYIVIAYAIYLYIMLKLQFWGILWQSA